MSKISVRISIALCLLFAVHSATAQDLTKQITAPATAPVITGTASAERVRFTAPSNVVRMQLQVVSEGGQILFDVSSKGNVLDWSLQDSSGQRLQGSYLTVVTVKSLSGRLSERTAAVSVAGPEVELKPVAESGLLGTQQQMVGPVEENSGLTILKANEGQAVTVVANNGSDGQIIRDRGALSFRLGDFFSGMDQEQMRLTEEGNLGIGTAKPEAKLDVAGTVRAREGFAFSDGSTLNVNDKGALTLTNSNGTVAPNVSGTGTQNRLAKWTDSSGTLGDSVAIDTGTGLQLTAAPSGVVDTNLLYLNSTNGTTGVLAGITPSYGAANGPFFAMRGNTYTTIANQRGLFTIAAGNVSSPTGDDGSVKFNTGNDLLRMVIRPSGNVGIGVSNPGALLDVAGNINSSTQYNIGGSRVLSIPGAGGSNVFAGVGAGQNNSAGVNNSFFGKNAGLLNTGGFNNAFFGQQAGQSSTGNDNSFFGDRAGFHTSTGGGNAFFGEGAGQDNTMGASNSALGAGAGASNTTGGGNTFVGVSSGFSNGGENNNTFIGTFSNGAGGITNATAIGYQASVMQSNSIVLGSINGTNFATADTNVGIGTTSPAKLLHLRGVGSDGNGQTDLRVTGTGATASGITLESTGVGGRTYSLLSTANSAGGGGVGGGKLALFDVTAIRYRLIIDSTGNVGIGSNSGNDIPNARLSVQGGDAAITTPGNGLILRATDGSNCYRVTVNNAGVLNASLVLCP